MSSRGKSGPAATGRAGREGGARLPAPHPPVRVLHPALLLAALAVGALVVTLVTFPITDPDLWQHLTVGKAIWQAQSVPQTHQWSWPTFGIREVLPSWLFRALLWPVWDAGGVNGLFVWRWVTTLAAFALGWAAARKMGARGFSPLVAIALCAMVYRGRTMVRPETLVAPLFALAIFCLVWRRAGGRIRLGALALDPAWALAPIACVWANVHLSYWLVFLLLGAAWFDDTFGVREAEGGGEAVATPPRSAQVLVMIGFAAALMAFLNPFGWRALWQPFEYFLFWRNEPIYKTIGELSPVDWGVNFKNGLPILVTVWPLLVARRFLYRRRDLLELTLCATLLPLTLGGQRFMGFLAIGAAPFIARDLAELASALLRRVTGAWPRAALSLAAIAVLVAPLFADWSRWGGIQLDMRRYPVAACDFLERNQVRGRIFNAFFHGGYLLSRFWPQRDRLPFMDIHQSGTRADRDGQAYTPGDERAWQTLDATRQFEIILWPRYAETDLPFIDRRDTDSTWALVFADDAAALYVRRIPKYAALIASHGYALLPGGAARFRMLQPMAAADSVLRGRLVAELRRSASESPASSRARYLLGSIEALEGRLDGAEREFRAAALADPDTRRVHEGLGAIAAARGDWKAAIREFLAEGAIGGWPPGTRIRLGAAYAANGQVAKARAAYEAELRDDPGNGEARDSLDALQGRASR